MKAEPPAVALGAGGWLFGWLGLIRQFSTKVSRSLGLIR